MWCNIDQHLFQSHQASLKLLTLTSITYKNIYLFCNNIKKNRGFLRHLFTALMFLILIRHIWLFLSNIMYHDFVIFVS